MAGEVFFSWPGLPLAPAAAVLGGFASWLSVARLTPVLRWSSVAVMILTTVVSYGVLQLGVGSG